MKSIMHSKQDGTCYLCMILHGDYSRKNNLQEHHVIYGTACRALSEKYGLKIYLCLEHHTYDGGSEAVHRNDRIRRLTEIRAKEAFERQYPGFLFREVFGRDVETDKKEPRQQSCGIQALENPLSWEGERW